MASWITGRSGMPKKKSMRLNWKPWRKRRLLKRRPRPVKVLMFAQIFLALCDTNTIIPMIHTYTDSFVWCVFVHQLLQTSPVVEAQALRPALCAERSKKLCTRLECSWQTDFRITWAPQQDKSVWPPRKKCNKVRKTDTWMHSPVVFLQNPYLTKLTVPFVFK